MYPYVVTVCLCFIHKKERDFFRPFPTVLKTNFTPWGGITPIENACSGVYIYE